MNFEMNHIVISERRSSSILRWRKANLKKEEEEEEEMIRGRRRRAQVLVQRWTIPVDAVEGASCCIFHPAEPF